MNNTTDGFKVALPDVPFMADMQALYQKLKGLTDYRKPKGVRYALALLAVLALLAKLAGQTTFEEIAEWAKGHCLELVHFLGLSRPTMPHAATFSRVLGDKLNCVELEGLIGEYFKGQIGPQIPQRGSLTLSIEGWPLIIPRNALALSF